MGGKDMARSTMMSRSERRREIGSYVKSNWQLYAMLLVPVVFVLVFKYAAYPGLRIAFMNYKPAKGYAGSAWVGMENFQKIFKDKDFLRALKNSLAFNFLDLLVGFPVPIILALLLNELRFERYKKVSQTVLYLPHFLSSVIIVTMLQRILAPNTGVLNQIIGALGGALMMRYCTTTSPFVMVILVILAAIVFGVIYSSLLAVACINFKADQTLVGTAMNLLGTAGAMVIVKAINTSANPNNPSSTLQYISAKKAFLLVPGYEFNWFMPLAVCFLVCPG